MAELIYGKNTIIETMQSGHKVLELYVSEQVMTGERSLIAHAQELKIKINVLDKKQLNNLVTGNHQGVIAKIEDYKYYEVKDIIKTAHDRGEQPFLLILDGLEDPHNLGAILRTAEASGVHGIIIPKNRSVSLNATVAKLSTGAIEYVKVARVTNINQTIKELKDLGIWVIGTDLDTDYNYTQIDYKIATALVIGNEGKGISRLVKTNCDALVKIPMLGNIQSLNASVSASILMYEVVRQRGL
jgi:23S rRNA (guanosine2251-2'-O)-methyltransferase